ncbi:hypothetical protein [Pyxidicoccus xibeiensis]|uniref:hypothetical protein n=1 Tax=Pyxidicoccus xibeiensis TaxID=2906759 RepID=UPI0020A7C7AF|nr:hypothetical protein [Pyxidicoccus xibeiensis]MCP3142385.1 hypothetical protein [Pyxidicoccus xibeiensis]
MSLPGGGLTGRFPDGPKVLTVLEEQAMLDDANDLEALRILGQLEPARAIPLLLDAVWKAGEARPEPKTLSRVDAYAIESARRERGMKALLLLGRLGARAASALPTLSGYRKLCSLEPYADAAIDDIVRDLCRNRAPPLPAGPAAEARVAALLRDVPPPRLPADTPAWMLARWAEQLRAQGPEMTVRVALAAARRVLGLWEYQDPTNDGPRRAVMAMDAWLQSPTDALVDSAVYDGHVVPSQAATPPHAYSACWSVTYATRCLPREEPRDSDAPPLHEDDGDPLGACVWAACRALSRQSALTGSFGSTEDSPDPLTPLQSAREIHQAILDEVLPWAHGTWDPVKDVARLRDELAGRGWKVASAPQGRGR